MRASLGVERRSVDRFRHHQGEAVNIPDRRSIQYDITSLYIIIAIDASGREWGAVIMQVIDGVRPARYGPGAWSASQATYDSRKLECRAVLMALKKKFRHGLYGIHWTVETDAG